jgi:hypothetical protein
MTDPPGGLLAGSFAPKWRFVTDQQGTEVNIRPRLLI